MAIIYDYENRTAFNPETGEGTPNAVGQVYAKTDTTFSTPLVVTLMGSGLSATDLTTDQYCQLQGFQVADLVQVVFKSGDFTKILNTTTPLVGPAGPAVAEAVDNGDNTVTFLLEDGSPAATVALPEATRFEIGTVETVAGSPLDAEVVADQISTPGTLANTALTATIVGELDPVKRALRPGPGNTVAIGDSLTAWDGDGSPLRQRDTWFQQLCARTNQRIRYGGVFATGSFKLSDIRATHLPSVLALDPAPAACFVFGGTNTETAGVAAGFPVLIDICEQLEAKGIAPVLVTLLPRSDANNTNHQNWNNALRTLAARRGWLLYDPAPALLTAGGTLNAALYADSAPAIHPVRPAGHTAMAKRGLSDDLAAAFPKMRLTAKEANSANNLLPFNTGLFLTDTDGNGLADNWSPAGTNVTYALVAPSASDDVSGNWQKATRTTGGTTSTVMQRSASSGFAAGDRVALSGRYKATVEGTGSTYTVQAQWTGATGAHALEPIYTWQHDSDGTFYGEAIVPAGTTSINVQIALSVPTSGTPSIQVAEVTLANLSAGASLLPA